VRCTSPLMRLRPPIPVSASRLASRHLAASSALAILSCSPSRRVACAWSANRSACLRAGSGGGGGGGGAGGPGEAQPCPCSQERPRTASGGPGLLDLHVRVDAWQEQAFLGTGRRTCRLHLGGPCLCRRLPALRHLCQVTCLLGGAAPRQELLGRGGARCRTALNGLAATWSQNLACR
jgi:hypothetical protein